MKIQDITKKLKKHKTKRYKKRSLNLIRSIAIHHSATQQGNAEAFARYHVNHNKWPGIGYHYVVDKKGNIFQTNKLTTKSYHVGNSNKYAIGICLIGNFVIEKPTDEQIKATVELCDFLAKQINSISDVKGHSEYPNYSWKQCPAFDVSIIKNLMKEKLLPY